MKFTVNGHELEYDFLDVDNAELIENTLTELQNAFESCNPSQFDTKSAEMRWCCITAKEYLGKIISDIDTVLPGNNYGHCMTAIAEIVRAYANAQEESTSNIRSMLSPTPAQNRAQRRRNKHKKH